MAESPVYIKHRTSNISFVGFIDCLGATYWNLTEQGKLIPIRVDELS